MKKTFFFIAVLLFFSAILFFGFFKMKGLSDIKLGNIVIDGRKFSFTFGKLESRDGAIISPEEKNRIYNLVSFYQWTLEDPLFTSPDFDVQAFQNSIDLLKEKEREYKDLSGRNISLFPLLFLESLPRVFENEKNFLDNPSPNSARNLIESYKATARNYQKEASFFNKTLSDNKNLIGNMKFVFINTYTTIQVISQDIEKIYKNTEALEVEILKREACLEKGKACIRPSENWGKPKITTALQEFELLSQKNLFPNFSENELGKIRGPYAVQTPCFGWGDKFSSPLQPFYISKEKTIQNNKVFSPKLASTNYYRRLSDRPDFLPEQKMQKEGYEWIWQPETNNYLCTDLTYQPRLATLDYFLANFSKPILNNKPKKSSLELNFAWNELHQSEKKFFDLKIPDGNSLKDLSKIYAYAYRTWPREEIDVRRQILRRKLIIERDLGNFHQVLNKGISHFRNTILRQQQFPELASFDKYFYSYVFLYRNPWQILYLPFSESFWRINESLSYLEKGRVKTTGAKGLYISFQEARKKFSEEEIKNWYFTTRKFLEEED